MGNTWLIAHVLILALAGAAIPQTSPAERPISTTLYSPIKYQARRITGRSNKSAVIIISRRADFQLYLAHDLPGAPDLWPSISYGNVQIGNDRNWFRVQGRMEDRSVIQDLGKHSWTDSFNVPDLPPLPALEPGQKRRLIIDGRPYDPDSLQARVDMEGVTSARKHDVDETTINDFPQLPPPYPPVHKASVVSVQDLEYTARVLSEVAVTHMYVVHVVTAQVDFYVLVHVDALAKGRKCTISWKRISGKTPE